MKPHLLTTFLSLALTVSWFAAAAQTTGNDRIELTTEQKIKNEQALAEQQLAPEERERLASERLERTRIEKENAQARETVTEPAADRDLKYKQAGVEPEQDVQAEKVTPDAAASANRNPAPIERSAAPRLKVSQEQADAILEGRASVNDADARMYQRELKLWLKSSPENEASLDAQTLDLLKSGDHIGLYKAALAGGTIQKK